MLYELPKTKRYILIGASAVVLAVLLFFLFQKNKENQFPANSAAVQEKTKQESQKLDQIKENSGIKNYSAEEIKNQSRRLDELRARLEK